MIFKEIVSNYVNRINDEPKERIIGRYHASEVNSIRKGYLLPKDFFKPRFIDEEGCGNISSGVAFEDMFTKMIEYNKLNCKCGENQAKYEIKITDDIVIACKPDFEFDSMVIETKFPVSWNKYNEIKPSYADQLECEYRATNKKIYLGYFTHPFGLKLKEYKPSNLRWSNIQKDIINFDKQLRK